MSEKKELVNTISTHKLKKQFFLGTGNNSLTETIDFIKYAMEFGFNDFSDYASAYYKKTQTAVYLIFIHQLSQKYQK